MGANDSFHQQNPQQEGYPSLDEVISEATPPRKSESGKELPEDLEDDFAEYHEAPVDEYGRDVKAKIRVDGKWLCLELIEFAEIGL